jgi:hypothetical protein
MSGDITGNDRHNWKRGESLQWGARGLPHQVAQTPYKCERCGKSFIHFYHQEPNIYAALEKAGITDECRP